MLEASEQFVAGGVVEDEAPAGAGAEGGQLGGAEPLGKTGLVREPILNGSGAAAKDRVRAADTLGLMSIANFVQDFVAAWTKVMNLDRFDLA